jgi:hypothetical protein
MGVYLLVLWTWYWAIGLEIGVVLDRGGDFFVELKCVHNY